MILESQVYPLSFSAVAIEITEEVLKQIQVVKLKYQMF
jgi:hypothetical protein